jgi:hypothetical protein
MVSTHEPGLLHARDARLVGTERDLTRGMHRGELVRVRSGVYLPTTAWTTMGTDERYRTRVIAAAAAVAPDRQFSHDSAAAMWRMPSLGPWSPRIHVLGEPASGGRSSAGFVRHGIGLDSESRIVDTVRVTSLARTVLDIAMTVPYARAVCMIDDALRPPEKGDHRFGLVTLEKSELLALLGTRDRNRGAAKAARAVDFSTSLSGSIGESISRINFQLLRLPAPELQVPFFDEDGLIGYVDFYWPHLGLIGEFDGRVKYRGEYYLRGRLPEDVVWAEKLREDRLRRVSDGFVRWNWSIARDRARLQQRVAALGLLPQR